MKHLMTFLLIILSFVSTQTQASSDNTYIEPADFVKISFKNQAPDPKVIWLKDDLKNKIEDILSHKYSSLRIRYWKKAQRSVWILDEIGKTKPITTGIVIDKNRISQIKVLVFRESRGWEVRHPFFTKQFIDATLIDNNHLDKNIDGISGATLSVRALTKLARVALLLNLHTAD